MKISACFNKSVESVIKNVFFILNERFMKKICLHFIVLYLCVNDAYSLVNHSNKELLQGVLIEGVSCSGKSTVCNIINNKLKEIGVSTALNSICLSDHYLIQFLLQKGEQFQGLEDSAVYYACATVLDSRIFKVNPEKFYIQDRNWLTQAYWFDFCPLNKSDGSRNYVVSNHQSFKWNVYLTLSYTSFKDRCNSRNRDSFFDKLLSDQPDLFKKYNEFCLSKIPDDENWLIIDTDSFTAEQVADQILHFCETTN